MNAQARRRQNGTTQERMSAPLISSVVLHSVVILIGMFGLPFISKPPPELAAPIPIELADISDITQTTKPAERERPKPPEEKPEPPKAEPERPKQAPKQTAPTPPKPVAPPKDELKVPDKTAEKPKPEKPKEKPAPKKPPVMKTPETKETPQEDPFQSLLKNLQDEKPDPAEGEGKAAPQQATQAPLGERMTLSEMDALRQQLSQCWNVLAGARYAEDLVVDMKLYVNPDRSVRQATVVDTMRYTTDNIFRAAADSAMRAVRDPKCSPLMLPPDKYNQWKEITVRFDPREIL